MPDKSLLHYFIFTTHAGQGPYYEGYGFLDLQTDSFLDALGRFHELKDAGYQSRFKAGLPVNDNKMGEI